MFHSARPISRLGATSDRHLRASGDRPLVPRIRLAKALNTSPEFWLDFQRDADLFATRQVLAGELEEIPVLRKMA
jgi:hypothetical protein